MKVINLSKNKFDSLSPLKLDREIINTEGTIHDYNYTSNYFGLLKELYISDLQKCNFMVKPYSRNLYVVDLDSCKISNNVSTPARYLTPFAHLIMLVTNIRLILISILMLFLMLIIIYIFIVLLFLII